MPRCCPPEVIDLHHHQYKCHKDGRQTIEIPLPTGSLGVAFTSSCNNKNNKKQQPVISAVKPNSALEGMVQPGYIFESLCIDDQLTYQSLTMDDLIQTLGDTAHYTNRKITFIFGYPDTIKVKLPAGPLFGMKLVSSSSSIALDKQHKNNNNKPIIMDIDPAVPEFRSVRIGMAVHTVRLQNGYELTGGTTEELLNTIDIPDFPGGMLICRDPFLPLPERFVRIPPGDATIITSSTWWA
mmetsp:Transcript_19365/g.29152  ORF Transcript_19365/g.29152 Transcript_19365/m.29152 type:complete len:239 (-) Transcript_19365:216-932(-)|eukprot:CAMPEP_0178929108 /NCGR_PEP_ID=MMETSP0786-20121207/20348_1 /TAXON_ID=186022 /ORGANISM="Thalassionema frauenfeldii, Strain CCMP 1798" /LENGTH=238 /DNA_ID=CAMNT_0020605191 /DNA_START=235 /DNA_END=951 /DNA_ORIENTATION=-